MERGGDCNRFRGGSDDLVKHLSSCNHISIEANYDHGGSCLALILIPSRENLRKRGHLSNSQVGEILLRSMNKNLRSIVLCHLSRVITHPILLRVRSFSDRGRVRREYLDFKTVGPSSATGLARQSPGKFWLLDYLPMTALWTEFWTSSSFQRLLAP